MCRWRKNTRVGSPTDFAGWAAKQRPSCAGVETLLWPRDKARSRKGERKTLVQCPRLAASVTQAVSVTHFNCSWLCVSESNPGKGSGCF